MTKEEKKRNIFLRILLHPLTKTFVGLIIVSCIVVALALFGLKKYTRHGESVDVPSVKGMQVSEAMSKLESLSLNCEVVDSVFLVDAVPGSIIEQVVEQGSKVKKGRTIYLTIQATGAEMVTVPELRDFSVRAARALLTSLGFKNIQISEVASAYQGLVLSVKHDGETIEGNTKVPKGSPITLVVGAGGEVIIDSIVDLYGYGSEDVEESAPEVDNSYFD